MKQRPFNVEEVISAMRTRSMVFLKQKIGSGKFGRPYNLSFVKDNEWKVMLVTPEGRHVQCTVRE